MPINWPCLPSSANTIVKRYTAEALHMCKRKRTPKPTDGTADLLVQSDQRKHNWVPRESWNPLRLRMWRVQMKVAVRLRILYRSQRLRSNGAVGAAEALLASHGLRRRFVRGDRLLGEIDESSGGIEGDPLSTLRTTVLRRAVQVARERATKYVTLPSRVLAAARGQLCFICSGPHGTTRCFTLLRRGIEREDEHIVIARNRLALESDNLVRAEESMRIASSLRRRDVLLRQRAVGVTYLAWCMAKYGLRMVGVLGTLPSLIGLLDLFDDAYYIATGGHFVVFDYRRFKTVFDRLWETETLLDFMEREMRAVESRAQILGAQMGVTPPPVAVIPEAPAPESSTEVPPDGEAEILKLIQSLMSMSGDRPHLITREYEYRIRARESTGKAKENWESLRLMMELQEQLLVDRCKLTVQRLLSLPHRVVEVRSPETFDPDDDRLDGIDHLEIAYRDGRPRRFFDYPVDEWRRVRRTVLAYLG